MRFWQQLTRLRHTYTNLLDRQRAYTLLYLSFGIFVLAALNLLLVLTGFVQVAETDAIAILLVMLVGVVLYLLTQWGYVRAASYLMALLFMLAPYFALARETLPGTYLSVALGVVVVGTLLRWGELLLVATIASFAFVRFYNQNSAALNVFDAVLLPLSLIFVLVLLQIVYSNNIQRLLGVFSSDVLQVRRATAFMQGYHPNMAERDLLANAINVLRDDLHFTFAQVFLLGPDGDISRRVYSSLGLDQIADEENVRPEQLGGVREVLRTRSELMLTPSSDRLLRQHMLPGVLAGVLLPLRAGDEVVGVLDVQSEALVTFTDVQLDAIRLLTTQLSNALLQSRRYQNMANEIEEQRQVLAYQRNRLRELERAETRFSAQAWADYFDQRMGGQVLGYNLNLLSDEVSSATELNATMHKSLQTRDLTIEVDGSVQYISLPIVTGDQVLGVLSITLPANRLINQRQQEMMRNVMQRLALALENRRLIERTQAQAWREAKANEVAGRLLSTTDIQTVLRIAAEDFNEALGAVQTHIDLQPETLRPRTLATRTAEVPPLQPSDEQSEVTS